MFGVKALIITPIYNLEIRVTQQITEAYVFLVASENCSALFEIEDFTCILRKIIYYIIPKLAFCLKTALQTLFSL